MRRPIVARMTGAFCCLMKCSRTHRFEDSSHHLKPRTFGPTEDRLLRQPLSWEPDGCLSLTFLQAAVCRWELPMGLFGLPITARSITTRNYAPSLRVKDMDSIPT